MKSLKIAVLMLLFMPMYAYAQIVPCGYGDKPQCTTDHLFQLLVNIFNLLLGFLAFGAMLMIVIAGIRMITAHLGGNAQQELTAAKSTLTNAVIGFSIVALSFVIVNAVLALLGVRAGVFSEFTAIGGLLP